MTNYLTQVLIAFLLLSGIHTNGFTQGFVTGGSIAPGTSIPTNLSATTFDESCNGFAAIVEVTLPAGNQYEITSVDVTYTMTAVGDGSMADQQSQLKFVTGNTTEPSVSNGSGGVGTFNYNRTGLTLANGVYNGGQVLNFRILARRTFGDTPPCGTEFNFVDASSILVTVHYGAEIPLPVVGINTDNPEAGLDVNGKIRVGNDNGPALKGMIRFNEADSTLQYYSGQSWVGFTGELWDVDFDTGVESNNDVNMTHDEINFKVDGNSHLTLKSNQFDARLINPNSQYSNVLIGDGVSENTLPFESVGIGFNALKNSFGSAQVGIGYQSLMNSQGTLNVALGYNALQDAKNGDRNTAIGSLTMLRLKSGNNNVAVGTDALANNKKNDDNIAIGEASMAQIDSSGTSATKNIAIGSRALFQNFPITGNTGSENIAIGYESMRELTSGSRNIGIGNRSMRNNQNGSDNIWIGSDIELFTTSEIDSSIIIGHRLGVQESGKIIIGMDGAQYIEGDIYNETWKIRGSTSISPSINPPHTSAILDVNNDFVNKGFLPPRGNHTLISSPANGLLFYNNIQNALYGYKGASWLNMFNTLIDNDGNSILKMEDNLLSLDLNGSPSLDISLDLNNHVNFSPNDGITKFTGRSGINEAYSNVGFTVKGAASSDIYDFAVLNSNEDLRFAVNDAGLVGINRSPIDFPLSVRQVSVFGISLFPANGGFNEWEMYHNNSDLTLYNDGSLRGTFDSSNGTYSSSSDISLKHNIRQSRSILDDIKKLQVKEYSYKNDKRAKNNIGLIAQEVEQVFPELVTPPSDSEGKPSHYTLNYSGFGVLAIKAIQEQQEEINELKSTIEKQSEEIESMKAMLNQLIQDKKGK